VKYLLEKQANFSDVYSVPGYFSEEVYELMLEKGLKVDSLFSRAIELEPGEKHDQLLDLALSKKVDFSSIYLSLPSSISDSDLEKCFKHGLTIEILIRSIFRELEKAYNLDSIEYNQAKLTERQIEILNKAKNNDTDINKVFTESIESFYRLTDFDGKLHIIPEKILEVLLKNYALDSNLILIYGIYNKVTDIVKFAIENNADVNCVIPNQNISLFVKALFNQNIEGVNLLIEYGAKLEISIEHYIGVIKSSSFNFAAQIINKLPNLYTNDQLYEIFRSYGSSEAQIRDFLDLYDLIKEYVSAKEGNSTSISQIEMGILDGNVLLDKIIEYKEATLTNKYGYSLLHLSIIAGQYKLASKLVKDGVDINTKNHNNITPLQLLVSKKDVNLVELAEAVLEKADNIDISLGSGEILTDILIQNKDLEERVVELTNDSLFNLFKKEADLFSPSKDLSKTNIAISHGDNFWSTGIWSTARIISKNYPDVKIYLVRSDTLEKGGEAFLKQFDAVINPGAGDTYPKIDEFTKADCPFNMNLEKHYQNMLEFTHNHNIPYLGMCAGAQHFAMYHGGSLRPLKGYNKGQHQVKYIEGTYAHFMALTKAQQQEALQNCELPEIKFEGYTAHNYAAINEKLGNNMELGAVSEDNVAMSYAHS
ncbi:MAG: gamma-glutamyl-gamma-aminobutyrate hydrolase family protein, partial [Rickettsiales bacterium]